MSCSNSRATAGEMPAWGDEPEPLTTASVLLEQFGDVLIPVEQVRLRYFRNRNGETFGRALRDGEIPLPIVRLDDSHKSPRYVCLWHLAAYIDWRARRAALHQESDDGAVRHHHRLHRALIEAIPVTPAPTRG